MTWKEAWQDTKEFFRDFIGEVLGDGMWKMLVLTVGLVLVGVAIIAAGISYLVTMIGH